jgi:hypothetical protein
MRSRRPDDLHGVRLIDAPVWADLFTARFWTAALDTGADTPTSPLPKGVLHHRDLVTRLGVTAPPLSLISTVIA